MIYESRNPISTDGWLPSSYSRWRGLDILSVPSQPSATEPGTHTAVVVLHDSWVVWYQGLANSPRLTAEGQSIAWRAPGIPPHPRTLIGKPPPREGSAYEFFSRGSVRCRVIMEHFKRHSGWVADSEPETLIPHHTGAFWGQIQS